VEDFGEGLGIQVCSSGTYSQLGLLVTASAQHLTYRGPAAIRLIRAEEPAEEMSASCESPQVIMAGLTVHA